MESVTTVRNNSNLFSLREIWEANWTRFVFKTVASFLLGHWRSAAWTWHHTLVKWICRLRSLQLCFRLNFLATLIEKGFFCITFKRLINFCAFQVVSLIGLNWSRSWVVLLHFFIWIVFVLIRLDLIRKPLILSSSTVCSEILTLSSRTDPTLVD